MANKRDDDLDLDVDPPPRQRGHASSVSLGLPTLHAPRRSVALRFGIYVILLVTLGWTVGRFVEPSGARLRGGRPLPAFQPAPAPAPAFAPAAKVPGEPARQGPYATEKTTTEPGHDEKAGVDVRAHDADEEPLRFGFNGPLRFLRLGGTMRPTLMALASSNVLFAAGDAKTAGRLLPLACEMADEGLNSVHFVLLSRSDVPLDELLRMNGVDRGCQVTMHDARPDHSMTSRESRMRLATTRALQYMHQFIISKAIIVDGSDAEERYFLSGVRDHAKSSATTVIELPARGLDGLSWLTKLDGTALSVWNDVNIEILIRASPAGFGNIKRLLRSLSEADLGGITPPRITIELPSAVDTNLVNYLNGYKWPPRSPSAGAARSEMLSLRHRVWRSAKDDEDSESARFVESFWPSSPTLSHVLILSPHAEVTPQFFHYIKYLLLKYRYSDEPPGQYLQNKLLGISLAMPKTLLDGSDFTPPATASEDAEASDPDAPVLWQAPHSDALLITGDKWVELHGYITRILETHHTIPDPAPVPRKAAAVRSLAAQHPPWLEHALQLSRLRGYATLYPGAPLSSAMLGIHTDLHDAPYPSAQNSWLAKRRVLANLNQPRDSFDLDHQLSLAALLPDREGRGGGHLPPLGSLAWLSWDGKDTNETQVAQDAALERQMFREKVGQCGEAYAAIDVAADAHARDLFCARPHA